MTAKNIVKTGAFTVSIEDAENVVACDYVGIVSGNKVTDKVFYINELLDFLAKFAILAYLCKC